MYLANKHLPCPRRERSVTTIKITLKISATIEKDSARGIIFNILRDINEFVLIRQSMRLQSTICR